MWTETTEDVYYESILSRFGSAFSAFGSMCGNLEVYDVTMCICNSFLKWNIRLHFRINRIKKNKKAKSTRLLTPNHLCDCRKNLLFWQLVCRHSYSCSYYRTLNKVKSTSLLGNGCSPSKEKKIQGIRSLAHWTSIYICIFLLTKLGCIERTHHCWESCSVSLIHPT